MSLKSDGVPKASAVSPIKRPRDLKKIYSYLKEYNVRNFAIFVVGVNVLLRAGDLLSLKWKDVLTPSEQLRDRLHITEEKTGKRREIRLNKDAKYALKLYNDSLRTFEFDDYIFKSRKGNGPIEAKSLHRIITETCKELGVKGHFGSHTLRKTGAYFIYTNNIQSNPKILEYLQSILNHSSSATTLRYIGIEGEEIDDIFDGLTLFK